MTGKDEHIKTIDDLFTAATPEQEALGARLAARAESDDDAALPADAVVEWATGPEDGFELLEQALGSSEAVERATGGRPSLTGARGKSPMMSLRLTPDLDAALRARAEREHRKPSALMRDALARYLDAS